MEKIVSSDLCALGLESDVLLLAKDKEILVYADWMKEPSLVGTLYCIFGSGKEVYSFEYSKEWFLRSN